MSKQTIPDVVTDVASQERTRYVGLMSFVILVWDHFITFEDEIRYVWKQRKAPITCLFLFNRYFTPLAFCINLFAYFSPIWTPEMCNTFVRYEGVMFALNLYVVGLMMMYRIRALYPRKPWIPLCLTLYIIGEVGVSCFLIWGGEAVIHNKDSGAESCTLIFSTTISQAGSSAAAWMPLLYDSIVISLTLNYIIPKVRKRPATVILKRLLEDGILYYVVILGLALTLVLMIVFAEPGVKNISAQTEQLVTVAMMSRITLNLKKAGALGSITRTRSVDGAIVVDQDTQVSVVRSRMRFLTDSTGDVDDDSVLEVLPNGQKDRRPSGSRILPMERLFPGGRKGRKVASEEVDLRVLATAHVVDRDRARDTDSRRDRWTPGQGGPGAPN